MSGRCKNAEAGKARLCIMQSGDHGAGCIGVGVVRISGDAGMARGHVSLDGGGGDGSIIVQT